ncbi:MAG: hypothetical protein WCO33_01740 [bacterium]
MQVLSEQRLINLSKFVARSFYDEVVRNPKIDRETRICNGLLAITGYIAFFNSTSIPASYLSVQCMELKPDTYIELKVIKFADETKSLQVLGINSRSILLHRLSVGFCENIILDFLEKHGLRYPPSYAKAKSQTASTFTILGKKLRNPEKYNLATIKEFSEFVG